MFLLYKGPELYGALIKMGWWGSSMSEKYASFPFPRIEYMKVIKNLYKKDNIFFLRRNIK